MKPRILVMEDERSLLLLLGYNLEADGYEVDSVRSGAWLRARRRTLRARGVVVAAGPLGTNKLLQRCRLKGSLPGRPALIYPHT